MHVLRQRKLKKHGVTIRKQPSLFQNCIKQKIQIKPTRNVYVAVRYA